MVYGVLSSLSAEAGLVLWEFRAGASDAPLIGVQLPSDVRITAPIRRSQSNAKLGSISLQLLPEERTLVSIEIIPEHEETIVSFTGHLARRLIALGFADEPPPPKRPLGFTLP